MSNNREEIKNQQQQGQTEGQAVHRDAQPGTTATANLDKQAQQTTTAGQQNPSQQHFQGSQLGQQQYGQGQSGANQNQYGQGLGQQDRDRRNQEQDRREYDTEDEQETPLDYYETLGLKHSAAPARIEAAYKNLSLRHHPQHYAGQDRAANDTRFAHVSEAYQVLHDPERRRKYDEYLRKNNDKFREYQDKHRQETQQNRRNWRDLHPFHYRRHPYSPFNELFGLGPVNPFDHFNQFLNHGLFDDDDLDFFGFHRNRGDYGYRHHNYRNDFFGDRELRDYYRSLRNQGHDYNRGQQGLQYQQGQIGQEGQVGQQHHHQHQGDHQHHHQAQQGQHGQHQDQSGNQHNQYQQPIEISRSIVKHTRIENGYRTTVTETKKVNADGHVEHLIKEETEDPRGNRKVRFLNALPQERRHQITQHQSRQPDQHQNLPYNLGQDQNNRSQAQAGQTHNQNDPQNLNQYQREQDNNAKGQTQTQTQAHQDKDNQARAQ